MIKNVIMWKVKKSKVHGSGVFANSDISKNKKIIQYIGDKITKSEGDRRSAARIKKFLNKKMKAPYISLSLIRNMTLMVHHYTIKLGI